MFRRLALWFSLVVLSVLMGFAWGIASTPEDEVRQHLLALVGIFGLFGVLLVVILSLILARQFRRPVRALVEAMSRMGSGVIGPRIADDEEDGQLTKMADTFNRASEELTTRLVKLEEDRQQMRTILSGMVEGVVALDAEQRILYVNDRATSLLELPTPAPVGRPLWEVLRHRSLLDAVRHAEEESAPHIEEFRWGGATARSLTVHAARLPGEPPRGTVLVLHDTTELRRLERLRQDFVANVSHELKTPLSVIKVCIETLIDGAVDDVQHRGRFLEQIARQSDRLHMLILDLLSLARIESGEEFFNLGPVPLDQVVRACVDRYRTRAEARRQSLVVVSLEENLRVWAEEEAVEQILDNLLDNALKYTPEGGRIEVRWQQMNGQGCLEVADTGIGIPEADLPRIFERFYRVDKARSREMGGTGLGLSIVKHLAQALNGSVSATSEVGKGTTFRVCLPMAK
jgi:two-component system phosphate regulon sensor histidine kinase PhoR